MIRRLLPALLLACVGCAETSTREPPVMPAPRRSGAFQQFCEQAFTVAQASHLAAARGADGWELVAMYNGVLCFKRPAGEFREVRAAPVTPAQPTPFVPLVRDPGF